MELPDLILLEVFSLVNVRERYLTLRLVCHRWKQLAEHQLKAEGTPQLKMEFQETRRNSQDGSCAGNLQISPAGFCTGFLQEHEWLFWRTSPAGNLQDSCRRNLSLFLRNSTCRFSAGFLQENSMTFWTDFTCRKSAGFLQEHTKWGNFSFFHRFTAGFRQDFCDSGRIPAGFRQDSCDSGRIHRFTAGFQQDSCGISCEPPASLLWVSG